MLYVNPIGLRDPSLKVGDDFSQAREKEATQELERYFAYMLLQEMRKSVPKDSLLGGENEMKYFNEMLDDALAGEISKSGQWGIAEEVAKQMQPQSNLSENLPKDASLSLSKSQQLSYAGNMPINQLGAAGVAQPAQLRSES